MLNGKDYIRCYYDRIKEGEELHLQNGGDIKNYDSMECIDTVESVVGYYLEVYGEDAENIWIDNLTRAIKSIKENITDMDIEISKILRNIDYSLL